MLPVSCRPAQTNAAKARMNYAKTGCEVIKKEAKKWEFNNLCLP